jgi:hypothetical protein
MNDTWWFSRLEAKLDRLEAKLDELAKAFYQFRGNSNDVLASQRDALQASRERAEEEAARSLLQQDAPPQHPISGDPP